MTAGGGKYRRDDDGTWRYVATGEPVPGASDMTLSSLHNFRVVTFGDGRYVEVPRALAYRDPDLRWALDFAPALPDDLAAVVTPHDPDTGRAVVRVPIAEWDRRDRVVGLWAPELVPAQREGVRQSGRATIVASGRSCAAVAREIGDAWSWDSDAAWRTPVGIHWVVPRLREFR